MKAKEIQLALQGGGAKLSALLAVAEAVQSLQEKKIIVVKRIAGTSAGAIVGALLAAGVNIAALRAALRAGDGKRLVEAFPSLNSLNMGWKIWRGKPFWNTDVLEKWLQKIFEDKGVKFIRDCKAVPELRIMAANLSTSEMKAYTGDDELVPALMRSAGIPICFRTWKDTEPKPDAPHLIVDGGLGENLPVEQLSKEVTQHGEMVAVTFEAQLPKPPKNAHEYALAIIGTAIDVSVKRACATVPRNRLFTARTSVSTFDFQKAIEIGLEDAEYNGIRDDALAFFSALPHQPPDVDPWEIREPAMEAMMTDLAKVYASSFEPTKLIYEEVLMVATAHCLLPLDVKKGPVQDELFYSQRFKPLDTPTACHAISLAGFAGREYLGQLELELRDSKGREIPCTKVPSKPVNLSLGPDERQLLLFFSEPLKPGGDSYSFSFREVGQNIMGPLRQTGTDELKLTLPRAAGKIKKAIFVLYVPKNYPHLEITTTPEKSGRALDDAEILRLKLNRPNGFRLIGWMFEDIDASALFGVSYRDSTK